MTTNQMQWRTLMMNSETIFKEYTDRHNDFMAQIHDTSDYLRKTRIQQDTLLQIHISRLNSNFGGGMRRHIYNLKALQSFLVANDAWLVRINADGLAPQLVRRSWQARVTEFKSLYARIQSSQITFEEIGPAYLQITKVLPGVILGSNKPSDSIPN